MALSLYQLQITSVDEILLEKLVPMLPEAEQYKIRNYQFLKDRWRALLSQLFVRKILALELKTDWQALDIQVERYGKPYLKDHHRQFNLSHANNFIVLATDKTPIGVDIEFIHPLNDLESLIDYFSFEERAAVLAKGTEERLDYFFELWTLKESYVKAIGEGLSCPFDSFCIQPNETFLIDARNTWHFKLYPLDEQYKCAICAQHSRFPDSAIVVNPSDLF